MAVAWKNAAAVPARAYVCGFCGNTVAPNQGWTGEVSRGAQVALRAWIFVCPSCSNPTYFDPDRRQWPGVAYGAAVEALPDDTSAVYDEARRCMSVGAYSAATMACRKLLMHVAVEKGAAGGLSFQKYIDWLVERHYVPPGGDGWVDVIRKTGNETNHEIVLVDEETAKQVVSFVEFLLKFVYELPARVAGKAEPPATPAP